ncbi:MAG: membrane protein [Cyclobacteriaceae bacterium]|nr:MAG: membrane protein [Cyclobacteriaceae bacterium]
MDLIWTVIALVLMITGLVGCIVPLLPGPPLSYLGLLVLQLRQEPPFTLRFMLLWLAVVVVVQVLDYVFPLLAARKFGGTRYGVWGCAAGLLAGFWFGPAGIVAGPFIGALAGELLYSGNTSQALRSAVGSFAGFVFSTLLKFITSGIMTWYVVKALWP